MKNARKKGLRVRFSDFIMEHPRTPSDECSQNFCLPPTIRIEDWSTPPSEVSYSESLITVDIPFPRPEFMSSSSRDSLAVSSPDFPCFKRSCRTPGSRQIHGLSCSDHKMEPGYGVKNHDNVYRSSFTNFPQLLEQSSVLDEFILPRLVRPARTSKLLLSSSFLDLLQRTSFSADRVNSIAQGGTQETTKQEIITIHRDSIQDPLPALQSLMGIPQRPLGKSNKISSVFKRHRSHPLPTSSPQNGIDVAIPFHSETGKNNPSGDYYRHSIDVADFPFPVGIMLSSDVQSAILTRFHEKGLATTPERSLPGRMYPSRYFRQPLTIFNCDVPYPCVFDLDDYFRDLSRSPVSVTLAFLDSIPQVSRSECFVPPTAYERNLFTRPPDIDEEQQYLSGTEFSNESSSSEDFPLLSLLSYRLQTLALSDERRSIVEAIEGPGTTLEEPVNPDNGSVLSQITATNHKSCDVEQMHPSLCSHMLKQRQCDSFYRSTGEDAGDESLVPLVENYSSISALWHYPHQSTAQGFPSHYDRKLNPVIEVTSESECSSDIMTPKFLSRRFGSDTSNIMAVDRTPTAFLHRAGDSLNMVNCDLELRSQLGTTRQTVPHWVLPGQNDGRASIMNESARQMQKNVSAGMTKKFTTAGMEPASVRSLPSAPLRPKGRRVAPQRF